MKKILISQSIMWAGAILVASIVEEKEFLLLLLLVLASVSLLNLQKQLKKQVDFQLYFVVGQTVYKFLNLIVMRSIVFSFLLIFSLSQPENNRGCHLYGKIKFVEYGEDYKVKFVKYGEDLRIKYVSYGEDKVGKWKVVEYGEDYKIKIVEYGEDYKVKDVWYGQGCDQILELQI